jgi:serine/threonine protein kinase
MSQSIYIYPKLLGKGAFGEVSLGLNKLTGRLLAVKKETKQLSQKKDQQGKVLKHENEILKALGTPAVAFWEDATACYMVIPLLGPSLDRLHQINDNNFSLRTCATLGIQMLDQVEFCHGKGVLHRDIKPANFLMNFSLPHETVKLVDFGLAKKYLDDRGNHIPYRTSVPRVGSLRYMSKNIHKGIEASCRDDIASIGYVIIYLFVGFLPWKGVTQNLTIDEKHKAVLSIKESFNNKRLANKNVCPECKASGRICKFSESMSGFLDHADNLSFGQKPDYDLLRSYLYNTLNAHAPHTPHTPLLIEPLIIH